MSCRPYQALLSDLVAERDVRITRDVAYGPAPRQQLDFYEPRPGASRGPVCVFLYGGSWRGGARACYGFVGAALASAGIPTAIPDYRVFPEVRFPAFVEDAASAVRHVAAKLTSGPDAPLVLAGHSAGAHIAALVALDPRYLAAGVRPAPTISGLVSLSGPLAFEATTWPSTREIFATARDRDEPRPVTHVSASAPAALLVHGAADTIVKPWNMREMADAYRLAGRPVRAIELPGLGHTETVTSIAWPLRWRAPVLREIVDFIAFGAGGGCVAALAGARAGDHGRRACDQRGVGR